MQVKVFSNDVNGAMRTLKRKMQKEGLFNEMRRSEAYEKPSDKRRREQKEAVKRWRKSMRRRDESI